MAVTVSIDRSGLDSIADTALRGAAALWLSTAVIGQWVFVYYIAAVYGGPIIQGNPEAWNNNSLLIHGHIAGDTVGNLFLAAHVLFAATVTFGGTLQLIPQVRAGALPFHRWNGRLYILTAVAISIAGLYLVIARGSTPSAVTAFGISLNAVLIMIAAATAWRHARARRIDAHRRWALRTFILVSGVWFFRVGMMLWIFLNQGPAGIGENFDGPFVRFWSFANYLLPLAVLEIYLRTQERAGMRGRFGMAAGLLVLTAGMSIGIVMTGLFMWLPRI